jgi:hypothetical protein
MSDEAGVEDQSTHGVGPHPQPWPTDPNFDPELLENGDFRNVTGDYRYWSVDAIVEDLDSRRHGFHVAIENWEHDFNIGTVVRNANAFLAACVHIIGERRWDRRGAMSTHRYQHVEHHPDIESCAAWARSSRSTTFLIPCQSKWPDSRRTAFCCSDRKDPGSQSKP